MCKEKSERKLLFIQIKLDMIEDELKKYSEIPYKFLEAESYNKIPRYGREHYKNDFLKHPSGNVSTFMKSFVYLRNTEQQLKKLKKLLTEEKKKLESELADE